MITIDGSQGEGGGQILRTALSLSAATGQPFAIGNIRAGRAKPGLMRQHLTAVKATAEICGARIAGAEVGSTSLRFEPGPVKAGDYVFRIGSAGSTTLVLQTVLPPLAIASALSRVTIEGGTHNPTSPPFDFAGRCFLPLLRRMGFDVGVQLRRPGFYPAGGGVIEAEIGAAGAFAPLVLDERGPLVSRKAEALIANLPGQIAERELAALAAHLDLAPDELFIRSESKAIGPGNCLLVTLTYAHVCEVAAAFGRVNASSETVASEAAREAKSYIESGAPVGTHLADQLILPMALAAGGRFITGTPSRHLLTNIETVRRFLKVEVSAAETAAGHWAIAVSGASRF